MKRLIGGILVAAGILIGGASGLCTAWLGVTALLQEPMSVLFFLPWALMFGGLPMLIGFLLYKWGRSLIRECDQTGHHEFD